MFTRRLLWLPTSLLYLLFASPVLAGHSPPTTPYDPFHAIAALAPKPSEEPICCLKPLTPLEPVDDDLFLSFEDWKAKRFIESNHSQKNNPSPNTGTTARVPAENPAEGAAHSPTTHADPSSSSSLSSPVLDDAPDMMDAAPTTQSAEGTAPPASPHFRVPLTDRFNYASLDCSARVHTAHRAAKSASNILSSKRDRYMLSPCDAAGPQFVVVELCDDIRIDTVQLANFEFFSGVFREFTVSVAKTYAAADAEGWTVVGTYVGKNVRGVQSFHPPTSLRDFYRYIRIEFHSHYSNEYYCPISLLRVYGLTHLEQWKWDTWEEESRARQDQNTHTTTVTVDIPSEPHQPAESPQLAQDDPMTPQERLSPAALSSDFAPDFQDQGVEASHPSESEENHFRHSTDIARLEPSTSTQVPPSGSGSSIISCSSSVSSQSPVSVQTTNHSMHMFISNDSTATASSASSSVFISSRTANVSGINGSSPRSSSQPTVTTISAPHVTHTPASPPPQVNPPLPPSPSNVHTGESIYRTIMNRLSALEANTTLYARYVEEQTSAMREMLRRLSEDLGRLEGLGRAQAQMYARSVNDFERHRKEMEVEQRTLISQVNYLADEIVLEKRLGIAQLCLLLAVLVFLSVTRGSPGEFHIPRSNSGSADVTRGWGRRSLRLSGDWFPSRLRSSSSGPPSGSQGSHTPTTSNPIIPRAPRHGHPPQTAPAAFLPSPSTTPGPNYHHFLTNKAATATTPTFRQKRPPLYLAATPVQPHHRAPRSRSTHAMTRSRPAGSAASPTPPPMSILPVPLQRSSSYGTAFVGPVPRSARRWARSAHLHEVRRARHHHPHHQHQQHHHRAGADEDEDVFAATPAHRSAPVAGSFGRDVTNNGVMRTRTQKGERAAVNGGGGAGADTWVDTDTDADVDGDNGLWEVDAD